MIAVSIERQINWNISELYVLVQMDGRSMALESGRYMETVGMSRNSGISGGLLIYR